jgi:hypothetical protein
MRFPNFKESAPVDIEEYRPEPPRPLPPEPKRKYLPIVTMGAILVGTFAVTFAVLNRHELATTPPQLPPAPTVAKMPPQMSEPPRAAAPSLPNIERVAQCLSAKALSADELSQVTQALTDDAKAPKPLATPALNGTLDLQSITAEQAAEFTGMLMQAGGQLGVRAQQAFQQGLMDGICKLVPHAPTSLPAPVWPGQP